MEVLREVLDALNPRNPEVWSILYMIVSCQMYEYD